MNVVPFRNQPEPEPAPEKPEPTETFYEVLARKAIEVAGHMTIREAFEEALKMPLKDCIEAFQGEVHQ